jgi:hypothetical protein
MNASAANRKMMPPSGDAMPIQHFDRMSGNQ